MNLSCLSDAVSLFPFWKEKKTPFCHMKEKMRMMALIERKREWNFLLPHKLATIGMTRKSTKRWNGTYTAEGSNRSIACPWYFRATCSMQVFLSQSPPFTDQMLERWITSAMYVVCVRSSVRHFPDGLEMLSPRWYDYVWRWQINRSCPSNDLSML